MSNYKAALTDIYTAPSIQQVKGARESKAFNEVFTNESSKEIINENPKLTKFLVSFDSG